MLGPLLDTCDGLLRIKSARGIALQPLQESPREGQQRFLKTRQYCCCMMIIWSDDDDDDDDDEIVLSGLDMWTYD